MDWWEHRLNGEQRVFVRELLDLLNDSGMDAVRRRFWTAPEAANPRATNVVAEGVIVQIRPLRPSQDEPNAPTQCHVSIDWYEPDQNLD
jgi:hypothetical protein